ncbi:Putative zinc-finger [Chthonomonas calidirosea]|uniref:anti-sigma factor family protein n=1 Tax=Chthonomonas calidirosea TaxID=454171 RepID=UPI0006DD3C25|nr:zf-HC2 domain-containing protein [Chthonomonas calidirosea]CEK20541.1 Putative zinc-finger [Chthonomonas calidirosea]
MSDPCRRWRRLLSLEMDGALPFEKRQELFVHLKTCASCRNAYEAYHQLQTYLQQESECRASSAFDERVLQALAQPQPLTWWEKRKAVIVFLAQAAAGAVAAVAITWILLLSSLHATRHPLGVPGEIQLMQNRRFVPGTLALPLDTSSPRAALMWHSTSTPEVRSSTSQ